MARSCLILMALIIGLIFTSAAGPAFANGATHPRKITLNIAEMNLSDAIRLLANAMQMNIVLNRLLPGTVTLNLTDASPEAALDMLLSTHGLSRWKQGDIWLVGEAQDQLKQKQQQVKLQQIDEDAAPLILRVWQLRYAPASAVSELISGGSLSLISKRGHMRADDRTNQLYVQETLERLEPIEALIHRVDIPVRQVAVDARIVSVDADAERELGFDFNSRSVRRKSDEGGSFVSKNVGKYSLAIARLADGSLLDVKLAALEKSGQAELISSPSLYAANQQTASIEAGEEVPYQEISESGGTAIAFKKAVLGLKVTPQVLPDDKVLLHLQINQDRPETKLVMNMPTISTRQIVTSVLAKSGQTIVLGGIYENSSTAGEDGLPFLSNVPLLGWMFKLQKNRVSRRELLIFVTPTIVDHAL